MKKNLTELVFVIDMSGSMSGLTDDTIGGFNAMLEEQRRKEGEVLVSTVLFNHESLVLHDRLPLDSVRPMTREDYRAGGSTALIDALGGAVHHIGNIQSMRDPRMYRSTRSLSSLRTAWKTPATAGTPKRSGKRSNAVRRRTAGNSSSWARTSTRRRPRRPTALPRPGL